MPGLRDRKTPGVYVTEFTAFPPSAVGIDTVPTDKPCASVMINVSAATGCTALAKAPGGIGWLMLLVPGGCG